MSSLVTNQRWSAYSKQSIAWQKAKQYRVMISSHWSAWYVSLPCISDSAPSAAFPSGFFVLHSTSWRFHQTSSATSANICLPRSVSQLVTPRGWPERSLWPEEMLHQDLSEVRRRFSLYLPRPPCSCKKIKERQKNQSHRNNIAHQRTMASMHIILLQIQQLKISVLRLMSIRGQISMNALD